jgi:hypothetical protein
MSIRRWHWGKIVILWTWGGLLAALLLTRFLSQSVHDDMTISSLSFLSSVLILVVLTVITWIWLGAKDRDPAQDS